MASASTHTPYPKRTKVGLWTILALVIAIGFTLLLSIWVDNTGKSVFNNEILQQTLSTIALLGAAFGPSLYANRQDTKIIKHEVRNDHSTNLRVENDYRHEELLQGILDVKKDIGGLRTDARNDREEVRRVQERVGLLERKSNKNH